MIVFADSMIQDVYLLHSIMSPYLFYHWFWNNEWSVTVFWLNQKVNYDELKQFRMDYFQNVFYLNKLRLNHRRTDKRRFKWFYNLVSSESDVDMILIFFEDFVDLCLIEIPGWSIIYSHDFVVFMKFHPSGTTKGNIFHCWKVISIFIHLKSILGHWSFRNSVCIGLKLNDFYSQVWVCLTLENSYLPLGSTFLSFLKLLLFQFWYRWLKVMSFYSNDYDEILCFYHGYNPRTTSGDWLMISFTCSSNNLYLNDEKFKMFSNKTVPNVIIGPGRDAPIFTEFVTQCFFIVKHTLSFRVVRYFPRVLNKGYWTSRHKGLSSDKNS